MLFVIINGECIIKTTKTTINNIITVLQSLGYKSVLLLIKDALNWSKVKNKDIVFIVMSNKSNKIKAFKLSSNGGSNDAENSPLSSK